MPDEANIKVEEAVQVKQSPEVAETNGPCQKELTQTASPNKLKENSNRAQDEDLKQRPADSGQPELLQCTLNSLQKEPANANWEVFTATKESTEEENPASAQDRSPDSSSSLTAEANHTETREHISPDTTHDDDEEEAGSIITVETVVAEPSGESPENNEVLSVPNTQLTTAACLVASISAVGQENDREAPSW